MDKIFDVAAQLPALAIFVWYVTMNNKAWRDYFRERNARLEKALEKIAERLDR